MKLFKGLITHYSLLILLSSTSSSFSPSFLSSSSSPSVDSSSYRVYHLSPHSYSSPRPPSSSSAIAAPCDLRRGACGSPSAARGPHLVARSEGGAANGPGDPPLSTITRVSPPRRAAAGVALPRREPRSPAATAPTTWGAAPPIQKRKILNYQETISWKSSTKKSS